MSSLSEWFQQLRTRRPSSLEARVAQLELRLSKLAQEQPLKNEPAPAVVIECVNIEHLHIAKLENSNNFGALGIKELGGKLNIGVNYSGQIAGEAIEDMLHTMKTSSGGKSEKAAAKPCAASTAEKQPVCHIRAKAL